ncbi:DUF3157 family protein [Shewanella violacea]|uniref:DUF3157 domain-containing protein n=1 Tax=Shewanella violacea (strain JCM 10179 / CIP 106290 / LMG 19151 / DSS12) TaxID=637905 RepID=D4ZF79_SHEVD|nr:DUF3157 family protein [Shewanella violacea]BAJ04243.1 conserved hypothetical protein [Shewanella violacea DSS12]
MHKRLRLLSSLALLVFLFPSLAIAATETLARVTLENGAKVRLNDDFTWEYVILETLPATSSETSPQAVTAITAIGLNTTSTINLASTSGANKATSQTMTASAMSQAELLKSTAKSGVKVSFSKAEWDDDGRLGLTFDLASTSSEHYVMIELDISLYDDSGSKLKTETVKVWKAIFRSPDTYLRKGEQRQSRTFWIQGINASQWTKQLLSLKIGEMNSRM